MKGDINAIYGQTGTPLPSIHTDYAEGTPMGATTGCTPLNPYVVNLDGYQREILEDRYKYAPRCVIDGKIRQALMNDFKHLTLIRELREAIENMDRTFERNCVCVWMTQFRLSAKYIIEELKSRGYNTPEKMFDLIKTNTEEWNRIIVCVGQKALDRVIDCNTVLTNPPMLLHGFPVHAFDDENKALSAIKLIWRNQHDR